MKNEFSLYVRQAFFPLMILWIPVIFLFGFGGCIMLMIGEWQLALYEFAIVLFPLPILFGAFWLKQFVTSALVYALMVYGVWTIIMGVGLFALLASFGGASMAVVDNPGHSFRGVYELNVFKWLLWMQPFFIVCAFIASRNFKKAQIR